MTHLHNDHASGAIQFPQATFVVDASEWAAACKGGFAEGYRREHYDQPFDWRTVDYDAAPPYATFERTLDLFGDGSVRLLSTPGHTRGHQSILLKLEGRELLLTADAAYTRRAIERGRPADLHLRRRGQLPPLARGDPRLRRAAPRGGRHLRPRRRALAAARTTPYE